jgi:hypothetical protein
MGMEMRLGMTLCSAVGLALLLAGCLPEPKKYLTSEADDDRTCRSYMKNKKPSDDTTYEQCRKDLVNLANNPPPAAPQSGNVTVIINQ